MVWRSELGDDINSTFASLAFKKSFSAPVLLLMLLKVFGAVSCAAGSGAIKNGKGIAKWEKMALRKYPMKMQLKSSVNTRAPAACASTSHESFVFLKRVTKIRNTLSCDKTWSSISDLRRGHCALFLKSPVDKKRGPPMHSEHLEKPLRKDNACPDSVIKWLLYEREIEMLLVTNRMLINRFSD